MVGDGYASPVAATDGGVGDLFCLVRVDDGRKEQQMVWASSLFGPVYDDWFDDDLRSVERLQKKWSGEEL
jgi:hypothetical protein